MHHPPLATPSCALNRVPCVERAKRSELTSTSSLGPSDAIRRTNDAEFPTNDDFLSRQQAGLVGTKLACWEQSWPGGYKAVSLQFRGALRGATTPVNLAKLSKTLEVQATGNTGQTVASIVEELLSEGAIFGNSKAGTFVPTYFARAQQRAAHNFYNQNGFIE
jgi:hypothetical protein